MTVFFHEHSFGVKWLNDVGGDIEYVAPVVTFSTMKSEVNNSQPVYGIDLWDV